MSFIVNILEDIFGSPKKHNESSGQISFDCPRCSEEKGVDGDGKGNLEASYTKGKYNCWACGASHNMKGGLENLIRKYGTKKQLKQYLLLKPEFEYEKIKENKDQDDFEDVVKISNIKLPEGFKLLKNCNSKDYKYDEVIDYLHKRGITDDIIEYENIGYTVKGNFFNRIVIPSYDENGLLNYFIARSFDKKTKPKYLNPDVEKQIIIINEIALAALSMTTMTHPNYAGRRIFTELAENLYQDEAKKMD